MFKFTKQLSVLCLVIGVPEEITGMLELELDGPTTSVSLGTVQLHGTAGTARLHVPEGLYVRILKACSLLIF